MSTAIRPVIPVPEQRLFSASQAARYLGVHRDTILELTRQGRLRAYRFCHRRVYRLEDLESLVESLEDYGEIH